MLRNIYKNTFFAIFNKRMKKLARHYSEAANQQSALLIEMMKVCTSQKQTHNQLTKWFY